MRKYPTPEGAALVHPGRVKGVITETGSLPRVRCAPNEIFDRHQVSGVSNRIQTVLKLSPKYPDSNLLEVEIRKLMIDRTAKRRKKHKNKFQDYERKDRR